MVTRYVKPRRSLRRRGRLLARVEQMAIRAARRVRKMPFAIGVTRQTRLARKARLIAVASVTALAVLMFGHLM